MTKPIVQRVAFEASPTQLFQIYTDSRKHSAATGSKAVVSAKVGARFTAFDGMLEGRNLVVVPNRMVVQAWRATHWKKTDPDSVLILTFSEAFEGGRIDLVHVGVPAHDHKGVRLGWPKYYWKPWRSYLKKQAALSRGGSPCGPKPPSGDGSRTTPGHL